MKRLLIVLITFFTVSGYLIPSISSGETVVIPGEDGFGISIEHYKGKNGWIPVSLFTRDLELCFRVNEAGEVFEWPGEDFSKNRPIFTIGFETGEIRLGENHIPFLIEEQNPERTRLRLLHKSHGLILKIDMQQNQVEFYIGSSRLPLNRTRAEFTQISYGLYELTFNGPSLLTYSDFIYESSTGNIYSFHDSDYHGEKPQPFARRYPGEEEVYRGGNR